MYSDSTNDTRANFEDDGEWIATSLYVYNDFIPEVEKVEDYGFKKFINTNKILHIPPQQRNIRAEIMTTIWRK